MTLVDLKLPGPRYFCKVVFVYVGAALILAIVFLLGVFIADFLSRAWAWVAFVCLIALPMYLAARFSGRHSPTLRHPWWDSFRFRARQMPGSDQKTAAPIERDGKRQRG